MILLAIDGNSLLNRAFYGIKLLSNKKGQFTNAIYGFTKMLINLRDEVNPDAVVVAFDRKAPSHFGMWRAGWLCKRQSSC